MIDDAEDCPVCYQRSIIATLEEARAQFDEEDGAPWDILVEAIDKYMVGCSPDGDENFCCILCGGTGHVTKSMRLALQGRLRALEQGWDEAAEVIRHRAVGATGDVPRQGAIPLTMTCEFIRSQNPYRPKGDL